LSSILGDPLCRQAFSIGLVFVASLTVTGPPTRLNREVGANCHEEEAQKGDEKIEDVVAIHCIFPVR